MTTRTKTELTCSCGHAGSIVMAENDAPFSRQYEDYSLHGLKGNPLYVVDSFAQWDEVFDKMKPECPKCGTLLTQSNVTKWG